MGKVLFLAIILILLPITGRSQAQFDVIENTLEDQFIRVREPAGTERRIEINDSIRQTIESYASSGLIFRHKFNNLKYLGQLTSADSLVKLITWNLILDDGTNNYYCYLITRRNISEPAKLTVLSGRHMPDAIRADTVYSLSDWYGALYYNLKPFIFNGVVRYVLLGIDYGNTLTTRKIIDVLTLRQDGGLQLGLDCFINGTDLKKRIVFEYAPSAVMSLKFESDKTIVFDHLSPFSPDMKGNYQFYGPDFSFDSYNLENGYWVYKSDIDIRNKD